MILALGARGREFDSRNAPIKVFLHIFLLSLLCTLHYTSMFNVAVY
jgi:hypothetical protein